MFLLFWKLKFSRAFRGSSTDSLSSQLHRRIDSGFSKIRYKCTSPLVIRLYTAGIEWSNSGNFHFSPTRTLCLALKRAETFWKIRSNLNHPWFNMALPRVYFDVTAGSSPVGRVVMEVSRSFLAICNRRLGVSAWPVKSDAILAGYKFQRHIHPLVGLANDFPWSLNVPE